MAREKGMGNLQLEKSGRWTMRVGINGKRYCRSTRTKDREKAERILQRFLAPLGLGEHRLPLAEVWQEYVKSPNRNELAKATLDSKRQVWMSFAKWMEHNHLEIGNLAGITADAVAEYLACLRADVCASTYNGRVCVLREIFHVLATKAGLEEDPWEGVRLRPDDSHCRRELTMVELGRLMVAAKIKDQSECMGAGEWRKLFVIGAYTGLRLGDCCRLNWSSIRLSEGIIQLIPSKTRRHSHGKVVSIPIHPVLGRALIGNGETAEMSGHVLPKIAAAYESGRWTVSRGLEQIFKAANVEMSVKVEGRRHRVPEGHSILLDILLCRGLQMPESRCM